MKKISENDIEQWLQQGFQRDQILKCRDAFDMFDLNDNEFIEIDELRSALENMGHKPTEEELYRMMNEGDSNGECQISFDNFMSIIYDQKKNVEVQMEDDIKNAFQALGGVDGQDGVIDLDQVRQKILKEFDMDIDMSQLILNYNEGEKTELKYDEFMDLMSN